MARQQQKTADHKRSIPVLTPPLEHRERHAASPLVIVSIIAGLVLLILSSAIVVWLLPPKISKEATSLQAQQSGSQNPAARTDQPHPLKIEAEQLLGDWLRQQAMAETENVSAWGAQEYADILQVAAQADELFKNGSFLAARAKYQKAAEDLAALLSTKHDLLDHALAAGWSALQENDSKGASQAFTTALAINPQNAEALRGFERAGSLDRVLSLYEEGLVMERANDLEQARKLLQEAVSVDRDFIPAADALARVRKKLQDMRFQEIMGQALVFLDTKNLAAADLAVKEARELRPDDPAVQDAARRLEDMKIAEQLIQYRQQAEASAAAEQWEDALKIYQKALDIDPGAGFGVVGQIETRKRYQLDRSLKDVLAKPERLQDDGPLGEARQLLLRAKSIDKAGPLLQEQVSRLEKMIADAAATVNVTLRSDNTTLVEIYHIGRFGPFFEKHLNLRPGKYIVVGKRPGYRDVRLTVDVKADRSMPLFVFIRCEEPL